MFKSLLETDEDDNNEDENINAKPSKKSFIKRKYLMLLLILHI